MSEERTTSTPPIAEVADTSGNNERGTNRAHATLAGIVPLLVSACGAAESTPVGGPAPGPNPGPAPGPVPGPAAAPTAKEAARFLAQAAMAATEEEVTNVQAQGYAGWLTAQFEATGNGSRWDWMTANGFNNVINRNGLNGSDQSIWYKAFTSPDTLRQRITLALSEIFVINGKSINGAGGWKGFGVAEYMDLLQRNAFGNYRTLLEEVTLSHQMGAYLSMRGSKKANAAGRAPDENYAREVLQLFSIGLYELLPDGSQKLVDGQPVETYGNDDVVGLAQAFTGWNTNNYDAAVPDHWQRPMRFRTNDHEPGEKKFLGTSIAAGTPGEQAMSIALDHIAAHANVGPFIGRQLIQRLVTSNPSNGYVDRVAAVWNDDGNEVRGNLRAVVQAILLDPEARDNANIASDDFGKVREPMLRLMQWGRVFKANDPGGEWNIRDLSKSSTQLGQSPLRSPSVFNFFRPGFVPPNSDLGQRGKVSPELQITDESSVIGYANFMTNVIRNGIQGVKGDYSAQLPLAEDPAALVDQLNLLLSAAQLSDATVNTIVNAVAAMPATTSAQKLLRVQAAVLLVMISPDYLVQK